MLDQAFVYYPWNAKVNNVGQGGRLQNLSTGTLQNLIYVYEASGNVDKITNSISTPIETSTYDYDSLDRLTNWTLNGVIESYSYEATGNLNIKAGVDLNYNDPNHKHAVTHIGATQKYWYDANGNQITRIVGADTFNLTYDAENHITQVKKGATVVATFVYDGDGRRVKSTVAGLNTYFTGNHYELTSGVVTKYYYAGSQRIAMRKNGTLNYILGDHLGSTSLITDASGNVINQTQYKAWGETRYSSGSESVKCPFFIPMISRQNQAF